MPETTEDTSKAFSDPMKNIIETQISEDEGGNAILSSLYIQTPIFFGLIVLYMLVRQIKPWIYYPNMKNLSQHPLFRRASSRYGWIKTLFTIPDTQLLGLIGLDSFMFLQTLKMLMNIMIVLTVSVAPWLTVYFYKNAKADKNENEYLKMTIESITSSAGVAMLVFLTYCVTAGIFYLIFIYYKRYIMLRQIYLSSPATMTAISKLKSLYNGFDGASTVEQIDVRSRSVLIDQLPSEIRTDKQCKEYINSLEIGQVENVILVKDTCELQKLIEQKKMIIQDIEKDVDSSFRGMKDFFRKNRVLSRTSFTGSGDDLVESAVAWDDRVYKTREKMEILNWYFTNIERFDETQRKSRLKFYLKNFKNVEEEIIKERKRIMEENSANSVEKIKNRIPKLSYGSGESINETEDTGDNSNDGNKHGLLDNFSEIQIEKNTDKQNTRQIKPNINNNLFIEVEGQDISFLSWNQLRNFNKYKVFFALDLPINKKKAFVTFSDHKTVSIAMNSQIGSKVFSCNASQAPAPYDILWKNLPVNNVSQYIARVVSYFVFSLIILFYSFAAIFLIAELKITQNTKNFFLRFISRYKLLFSLYNGSIGPTIYNLLQYLITFVFNALLNLQGIVAYSTFQAQLMRTFSLFSFFNSFLFICIGSIMYDIIITTNSRHVSLELFLSAINKNIIRSSTFFIITVIQRALIGTCIVLIKPAPFLFNFLITPFIKKSRRQKLELRYVQPINFGIVIPDALIIFSIVISYSLISPIIIFVGLFFYILTYFVYKNDLLYATKNEYESGGIYWIYSVKIILYSVIIFQTMVFIKAYILNLKPIGFLIFPLYFLDYLYIKGVKEMFERNCNNVPINVHESQYIDAFTAHALKERINLLEAWNDKEDTDDDDRDSLIILELSNTIIDPKDHYQDPSLAPERSELIFPERFFTVIDYIKKNDVDNIFLMKQL